MSPRNAYSIAAIAWKGVSRKMFRNLILMLAVSLLVALLTFAMLFTKAVEEDIASASQRLGADIVVMPAEAKGSAEEFILESKIKSYSMDKAVFDQLSQLPGIKQATYHIYLNTLTSGCCSIDEGQVIVFDPDRDFVVTPWLAAGLKHLEPGQIYVGSYVYDYLGLINTASLFGKKIKVVGHLQQTRTGLDHGIFMRLDDMHKISPEAMGGYRPGTISIIFIQVEEGVDVARVVADIRTVNPTVGVMTRGDIGADVRDTLGDIIRVFSITILISSLLALLLAWSTFTVLANERRREVGILRAIGAHQQHIMKIFLAEAMLISAMGGVAGVALGHSLIHYLAQDFTLLRTLGTVATITMANLSIGLMAMGAGIAICLLGAAIPIYRLARMEPLLAIKDA